MARADVIARSITKAVVASEDPSTHHSRLRRLQRSFKALFTIYYVRLYQYAAELFQRLRREWNIDASSYTDSFQPSHGQRNALKAKGDMGYSGSTFFTTLDDKYIVKSVPRHFEHSFFRDNLLGLYVEHLSKNTSSLLIRIMDFLAVDDAYKLSPAIFFGFAPSHHIVMENLLVGQEEGEQNGQKYHRDSWRADSKDGQEAEDKPWKWQTWDLKPTSYFFPERDIAQGKLTSQATKSRLADEFNDKLCLTKEQAEVFRSELAKDTELLQKVNAVDYSLFLVRIPVLPAEQKMPGQNEEIGQEDPFADSNESDPSATAGPDLATTAPTPVVPPFTPPSPPSWRTGVRSADGRFIYRAAVLDFFWSKDKLQPKVMTRLVDLWNKIDVEGDKGPMSITTSSSEYRERFTKMCEDYVEIMDP